MKLSKLKLQKGFSTIEMLLYMGILVILIGALGTIFGSILDSQLESKATSSVDQDGRYILARLNYDLKNAQTIVTPSSASLGIASNTLHITGSSLDYTYSLASGIMKSTNNNTSQINNLNSADTTISNLTFTRIGSGGSNDTIQVNFTISSTTRRNSGPETRSFQTTIGLP